MTTSTTNPKREDERTIEERLKDAGLSHRRDEHSEKDSRHTIYRTKTGEVLGRFEALEALSLIRPWEAETKKPPTTYQRLYVSPPMQIGKHQWRLLIERGVCGSGLTTHYEFQDESGAFWNRSQDWPGFNGNDTYLGLPKGLIKLYDREQPALVTFGLISQPSAPTQGEFPL